ncbi:MAG TPA: TCP-1/cpn60 chaperonin family protein, partial [Candidatus Diapherotrites archaeon]|nr:TCP-1/cpn60 chaperonin family protein [Candidatus Diapherotrites archaeon]
MANNSEQNAPFLPEGSKREKGRDAQRLNILVAKAVANAVKSTLGPKGMDKMLVDELGDVTISNDGATILKEMAIEHPVGKMLVELAKTQDTEIGDGTTTAVVLAGELVGKAEALLDENIHPSIIIKGYKLAAEKALDYFKDISLP